MLAPYLLVSTLLTGAVNLPPVTGVDGQLHRPLSEAKGRPTLMLFISHDCPVCNIYAPEIGRIEAKYGARTLICLVYSEPRLKPADAVQHANAYAEGKATLLLDPEGRFASACGATTTPQAVLFDAKGTIAYSGRIDDWFYGLGKQRVAPDRHDLRIALDAVLAHRTPPSPGGPPVGCLIVHS